MTSSKDTLRIATTPTDPFDAAQSLLAAGDAPAAVALLQAEGTSCHGDPRWHDGLAAAYSSLQRDDLALLHYRWLAANDAHNPLRWCDLALCLENLGEQAEAEAALQRALACDPDCAAAWAIRPQLALHRVAPDEATHGRGIALATERLEETQTWLAADPVRRLSAMQQALPAQRLFAAAYWPGDITALLTARGRLAQAVFVSGAPALPAPNRRRLRLGIFSRMFFRQSVFYVLLAGLIDRLDRSRFELVLFNESTSQDDISAWARGRADRYYARRPDWVPTLCEAACDILFYPDTGMDPLSQWLAMQRLAPLQATTWGHPVTSGLPTVDLFFSGELLEPEGAQAHYREHLVRLPGTGVCTPRLTLGDGALPQAVQDLLAERRPIALVPAMDFKLAPASDRLWLDLAQQQPHLRLVFFRQPQFGKSGQGNVARIAARFAAEGLDFDRHAAVLDHLEDGAFHTLLRRADLYLDVPSFSGYTTALQGLAAGIPIVTLEGAFLRQRLAAGMLRAAKVTDTIAGDPQHYLTIVAELLEERQRRPAEFAARRARLCAAMAQVCNDEQPIREMEQTMIDFLADRGHPLARAMQREDAAYRATALSPLRRFLHVGCGGKGKDRTTQGFNRPEWHEVRLDIDPSVLPDVVASMTAMAPVADASMDAVFSSHNLEHLEAHEVPLALAEFRRVLRPSGFLVLTCPDVQAVCALVAQGKLLEPCYHSPAGPIAPIDILWGHRASLAAGNRFMAHRTGFTLQTLTRALHEAGFATVAGMRRGAPHYDLWIVASKTQRDEAAMRQLAAEHLPRRGGSA